MGSFATAEDRRAAIAAAQRHLDELCSGKRRFTMSIPADPSRDSDLILEAALSAAEGLLSELEAAQARLDKVAEFIDQRREVITALRNAGTGAQENGDYPRWQGHAEARRVLAEALGIDLDKETGGLARALGLGEEGTE